MAFTGTEDHIVDMRTASSLTKNFRDTFADQPLGIYFSKQTLMQLLGQNGAVGLRFYFGSNTDGKLRLVFSAVDADENDILGDVGDNGVLCPPTCGNSNALNS